MPNVEPSFLLYALLLEPGGCLRAHITLFELVEPEGKKKEGIAGVLSPGGGATPRVLGRQLPPPPPP